MIEKVKREDVDIVILPEMFNCPYENEKFIEYVEYKNDSYTLESIENIVKSNDIYILAGGSIPEKELGTKTNTKNIYNTNFLFNNNEKIFGYHRKMHLFDIDVKDKIYFKGSYTLTAGNKVTVIGTKSKIGKIGIGIYYDIRFPGISRIMALESAKILIFLRAFNLTTGQSPLGNIF